MRADPLDLVVFGDVRDDELRLAAACLNLVHQLAERLFVPGGHDHARTARRHFERGLPTDSLRCTGDHDDLLVQRSAHRTTSGGIWVDDIHS